MQRKMAMVLLAGMALSVVGFAVARADTTPPQRVQVGPVVVVISANTEGKTCNASNVCTGTDDQYHQSPTRTHGCGNGQPNDDGEGLGERRDCWTKRDQLKSAPADEGGTVTCYHVPASPAGLPVTFDGVMSNGPTNPATGLCGTPDGQPQGRLYTGVGVAGVGEGSAAAGGSLANGGCVQAFGYDGTPGHVIARTINIVAEFPSDHDLVTTNQDDEADVTACFGY